MSPGRSSALGSRPVDQGATHLIKVAVETALGRRPKMDVFGTDYPTSDGTSIRVKFCKICYLISRTVSDDGAHCGDMMFARSGLSPSSPRLRRPALCGFGLDRSARPSKSGPCR